jgi:glycosyltransferase involved in cell wall biosynthesis
VSNSVVVVTHGRFHSFDLAEQLQKAGRLAAIYSGYPMFKLRNTQVDPRLIRSFPWVYVPLLALIKVHAPNHLIDAVDWQARKAIRAYSARTLPECGIVTALSGSGFKAGNIVRQRGGAYVCDRGSTHILWQAKILEEEYSLLGIPWSGIDRRTIDSELEEYALADAITVPSHFVAQSFRDMGVLSEKLRVVPYGVNLDRFHPCAPRSTKFRVLFVGQLGVRKGLHYLLQAFQRASLPFAELVLAGGMTPDAHHILKRYPVENMTLTGTLSRDDVAREMSRASVMVLPSIEEGLALVQAQALACGCPVIGTTHTGAEDLFEDECEGFIVPPRNVDILADRLTQLYREPELLEAMREAALARVQLLGGWNAYGAKSLQVFDELLSTRSGSN